ncbi:MAG: M20 family metallopeptidase [Spirochaetes bacterium]|nr:M20 family metallopeptidase [Spirochaetota bacterium]
MNMTNLKLNHFLEKLAVLVNLDSGSDDVNGVNQVADHLKELFASLGGHIQEKSFHPSVGKCLEIAKNPNMPIDILFLGHMDTVFSKGTAAKRPFRIQGNKAFGPGVADMKAGLLMIYYLLLDLTDANFNWCVALNSHEELGSPYSYHWLSDLAKKSKISLVIETGKALDSYVVQRKGGGRFEIEFIGKAAHAGSGHAKGLNAISEMAYWIQELHKLTNYDQGTTVNVGVARGGDATNIVAEHAQISVDYRFYNVKEKEKIKKKLAELKKNPFIAGVKINITEPPLKNPMIPSQQTLEYFKIIQQIGNNMGLKIHTETSGGGSDGNYTAFAGCPTIDSMGPVGAHIHSDKEYLLIDTIIPRFNLIKQFIKKINIQ